MKSMLKRMNNIFRRATFTDPLLDWKNKFFKDLFCVLSVMGKLTSFTSLHLLNCWTSACSLNASECQRQKPPQSRLPDFQLYGYYFI